MKLFKKVRGSQEAVPKIEVNVDTVYIRDNIISISEDDFNGFEYDEIQYKKNEYIETIRKENKELRIVNDDLILDNIMMQMQIDDLILAQLI